MYQSKEKVPILLLFFSYCFSITTAIVDGDCMQDGILNPVITVSAGGLGPQSFIPDECANFCFKLGYPYAAAEGGTYCYCFQSGTGLTAAAGLCTATCIDGSVCGGATPNIFTVWVTAPTGGNITVSISNTNFSVGSSLSINVTASGPWLVDWGDGSGHVVNETSHAYTLPGEYAIQAFLEPFPYIKDVARVNVIAAPNASLVCPAIVAVKDIIDCNFTTVSQGQDLQLVSTFTDPAYSTLTYNIPGELSSLYGATLGSSTIGTPKVFAGGDIIILHTAPAGKGRISRVEVNAATVGWVALYGVRPKCSSGEYCWDSEQCNAGCLLPSSSITCSSGHLCSPESRCSGTCLGDTSPNTTELQYRLIVSFYVDVASSTFTYLLDYFVAEVYNGERLAIGCITLADCQSSPAQINTRSSFINEVQDQLAIFSTSLTSSNFTSVKHLVRVLVSDDPVVPMERELICDSASSVPVASVPTPYDATTEDYVLMGFYNISYTLTSEFIGSPWTGVAPILCQEAIVAPTLLPEVWVPLGITTSFLITYSSGAPMFTSLNLGPLTVYTYYNNVTGYVWDVPLLYSATGDYTATGNATNALNWVEFTSLIHVVPVVTDNWVATANCLCLSSTLGFSLVITLPSAPNPPWRANVTATYSGGTLIPLQLLDFGTSTGGGAAVELTNTFNVTILSTGNFTITFFLYNEVSNTTFNTTVLVEEAISNVSTAMAWIDKGNLVPGLGDLKNSFMSNATIIFTPSTGTGESQKWRLSLYPSGEILVETTSPNETLSYIFTQEGDYNITMSAYNPVQGWVDSDPIPIVILTEITGFELTDDGSIVEPNDTKIVSTGFEVLPPVTCVLIDFGDRSPMEAYGYESKCAQLYPDVTYKGILPNPVDIPHVYKDEGIYTVRAVATDTRISQRLELEVVIASLPCTMPIVSIVDKVSTPADAPKYWKSVRFFRATNSTINCTVSVPVDRWWTITEVNRTTSDPIRDVFVEGVLQSWNFSQLSIPNQFLAYGVYKFVYHVRVNASKIFPLQRTDFTYVEVIPSPLMPVIMDGSVYSVSRGFGQSLSLNPRGLSTDPDDPANKNFNITWWCREVSPTAETHQMDSSGNPIVYNNQSLPQPLDAIKSGLSGGGCFGKGPGTIDINAGGITFLTSSFVKTDAIYEIMVQINKNGRIAYVAMEVEVMKNPPPQIIIKCVDTDLCWPYNGGLLINPSSRLALKGECIVDCTVNMTYAWTIRDKLGNNVTETSTNVCSTNSTNSTQPVLSAPTCEDVFLTTKNEKDIAVSTLFFQINPTVTSFKFRLSGTSNTNTRGFAENLLILNKKPENGYCTINGDEGLALIDSFLTKCENWVDPENIGINTYAFYTYSNGSTTTVKKTMVASSSREVSLIFPVGYFEVRCEIWDVLGTFADVHVGFVNATMPTEEQINNFNLSTKLQYLSDIGDQSTMAMILMATGSIRENADWLSLDTSSFSNMSEAEILDRIKDIAKMNLDALKLASNTMDFATLPQINVGAGVLQAAVDGVLKEELAALTVDMETRETALDFLDKMTNQLDKVTVSSPQELVPFVSSSMNTISALMQGINLIIKHPERVPPTDQEAAVDWDYEVDIGDDLNMKVPLDRETQLRQNVLDTTRLKAKKQVDRMMGIIDNLSTKVQRKIVTGETVSAQTESGASVIIAKVTEEILREGMQIDPKDGRNASVRFPKNFCPSHYNTPDTDCKQTLGITAVVWPCVTHVFPDSRTLLNDKTRVINLDVFIREEKVDVSNETLPVTLEIPRDPETLPSPLYVNTSDSLHSLLPFVYHNFDVNRSASAYTVEITPVDDFPSQLVLLIDHRRLPTPSNFARIHLVRELPVNENGSYVLFVNSKENENRIGRFFLAVAVLQQDVKINDVLNGKNLTSKDFANFTARYTLRVYSSGCYYYNEITEQWSGEGLNVVEATDRITVCETKHLTPFGSGFFPVPNTIDFDYVFANAGFIDNSTLYMVLIILVVCYIIMMIWARFMDKKDIEHRGVTPLEDNQVEDKYLYEITFTTGPDKDAGTDSNIQFVVSGEYDETEVRILPPSKGKRYHRYSVDAFVMATPGPLGDIGYMRIWHDNSGTRPFDNWQLQCVIIRDLQTRKKFVFKADAWLAFDRSGTVDVVLQPSDHQKQQSFGREFYYKGNRSANEDNIWMSIFLRPTGSRFSRKERVSVGAVFLFLSLVVNALWYDTLPNSPRSGLFNLGPLTISFEQFITGVISGCIVYPFTLLLIVIFKRARPYRLKKCRALEAISKQRRYDLEQELMPVSDDIINNYDMAKSTSPQNPSKDKNSVKCIPWWTRWLAWLLILGVLAGSIFLVWSYGIMWGEIKTVKWFSSFVFSFFISLLIVQWLNVLILTTVNTACCRKDDFTIEDIDCDEELPHLNYDEEWNNAKPMDPSARRKVHDIGGVDPNEPDVAALVTRLKKRREMIFVLRDIGGYCLFLGVLSILVSGRTDYNAFLLQDQLTNAFIRNNERVDFSTKVHTADDLWHWMYEVVMKEIRAQRLYNNEPPYGLRGFIGDLNNRIMGYGVIRQVRVDPRHCKVVKPFDQMIHSCSGGRGPEVEDSRSYCDGWSNLATNASGPCKYEEFRYYSATQLEAYSQVGKLGVYGGGGYVIRLKGPQNDILQRFEELQSMQWINRQTRAVILEFSVFNANVNLFAICSVMAEFNEGGGIAPKWRFEPVRLLSHSGPFGYVVLLSECTFVIATVLFTLNELWKIKKQKCDYFASYWNIAELCILLTSYVCVGIYVYKYLLTREVLDKFNKTYGNGYIRLDTAVLMDQFYLYLISIVVFFSILKLIKLLQFNKRMDVLAVTIRLCWDELSVFFIAFGIIFFAFCCMFYFIFIAALESFARFISSIETSFKMMLGKFDFEEMNEANPISPILFFVFSVMNSMILINIMLTIILRAFNEVKVDIANKKNKYDVIDFVWSAVRKTLNLEKEPDNSVNPNVNEKAPKNSTPEFDKNTEELPDKVSQLMTYISQTYFDGKVNLNDPDAVKKIMQATAPPSKGRPFTSRLNMPVGPRKVLNSD